jgi:hypothetical protein
MKIRSRRRAWPISAAWFQRRRITCRRSSEGDRRLAGYPIAWEETPSLDQLSDQCPYSPTEIAEYLFNCHYHWALDEEPTTFDVSGPHAQARDADRRYWLFEARDGIKQRQWFVVVGTGKSPFDPSARMKRWMYAKTNDDGLSPDQFLDGERREQLAMDARPR